MKTSFPGPGRRNFLKLSASVSAAIATRRFWMLRSFAGVPSVRPPLAEFGYGDVTITSALHEKQLKSTHDVLMSLSEDSLLKPFRQMAGQPALGADLGGWYNYDPTYDWHKDDAGFAPGATFGQWISALARYYAITGSAEVRDKVLRLNRLYAQSISEDFFDKNRFPAYCYDKLVLGLIDSHQLLHDPEAFAILDRTTNAALPHLPTKAVDRELEWRPDKDQSFRWDESYTNPENLFIAYQRGAGARYRDLAMRYLDDSTWFDPLSRGENVLAGKHAYSYVNSLCSAMQAFLTLDSEKHLRAAKNGFSMLRAQSFATGGWGPDEMLRSPASDDLSMSLTKTHNSFETPCGSYAHFKLTRYLLRVTRDSRYGDSMERVMYNTVLGAKPLEPDGRAFYYSDYNFDGHKVYSNHGFPCCSGTLPQVATDYGINSYFRDDHGVWVNLYIPSTLRWQQNGTSVSLAQKGSYPSDGIVEFEFALSKPTNFSAKFRIPAWAEGASISINDKRVTTSVIPGTFAAISREWKNGDRVSLDLPMKMRLEAINPRHPETVALLRGPLVLFPIAPSSQPITRQQLLSATDAGSGKWQVQTATTPMMMLPFTEINDEQYSTYLKVSG